jgi:hypothetical protein
MKAPKRIELSAQQADALRKRVANRSLEEDDYLIIEGMIETIVFLSRVIEEKKVSIKRLLQRIFGIKTESSKNVLGKAKADKEDSPSDIQEPTDTQGDDPKEKTDQKKKRKGHGRNGHSAYTGAERSFVPHSTLKSGDRALVSPCRPRASGI